MFDGVILPDWATRQLVLLPYCIEPRGNPLPPPTPQVEPQAGCGQGAPGGITLCCVGSDIGFFIVWIVLVVVVIIKILNCTSGLLPNGRPWSFGYPGVDNEPPRGYPGVLPLLYRGCTGDISHSGRTGVEWVREGEGALLCLKSLGSVPVWDTEPGWGRLKSLGRVPVPRWGP